MKRFLLIALCIVCASGEGRYGSVQVNDALFQENNRAVVDDSQWIVINRTSQSRNKIVTKKDECSRYCIESEGNGSKMQSNQHKKINFIWHINPDPSEFNSSAIPVNPHKSKINYVNASHLSTGKCEIHLSMGCNNIATTEQSGYTNQVEVLKNDHLTEYSSNKFNVNHNVKELQLKIIGNVTWIFLEMPTGRNKTGPLGLSLVRINERNEVKLVANNPPPGGWQLKLRGRENSTYALTIIQVLPVEIASRNFGLEEDDNPDQEIDHDGIVIFLEDMETPESRQASLKFPEESSRPSDNKNFPRPIVFRESLEELSKIQIEGHAETQFGELLRDSGLITRGLSVPVDLAPETSLLVKPGPHYLVFTVTNNQRIEILHEFHPESTQFGVFSFWPRLQWIKPDQTVKVVVGILVQPVEMNVVNKVTLYVERNQNLPAIKKSVYTYLQSSSNVISDSTNPTIDWEFNNNCAGRLRQERCENSLWTVDVTVTDSESGLKTVTSQPSGLYPRTQFISGEKNAVHFIYASTCCYTTVEITASDVVGNTYTRTIDVTAWNNLNTGDIAAIVIGSLFLLLIIILLILLCVHCARKRKSADVSYTQRYGSRGGPSSRTEGTNF